MKELDSKQRTKLGELQKAIAFEEPKLKAAFDEYNATVKAAFEKLRGLVGEYEHAQWEFDRFHSEIGRAIMEFAGDSGDWQESEEGQRFLDWLSAWNDASFSILNITQPNNLTVPDPPLSAVIAALPLAPGDIDKSSKVPKGLDLSLNQVRSTTIREDWKRIADFARKNFPKGAFQLAKGATKAQIDAAEAILGFPLPEDVRESYRVHNGTLVTSFPIIGQLSSIDFVAKDFAERRSWPKDGWGTPDQIEGPIREVWWDTSRVQLTESGSGDGLTIDLDPAEGGTWGQVIHHNHEVGPCRVYAPSWGTLLRRLADDAEAGKISHDENYTWRHSQDWVFDPPIGAVPGEVENKSEQPTKRYFEFTAGTSNKFWEIVQEGGTMMTRYGKIGTNGQSTTKSFDNPEKAAAETAKMIAKKVKEGYVEKKP